MARARRQGAGGEAGGIRGGTKGGDRGSLYQEVTDRIVAELEAGRVPWVQPWSSGTAGLGLPRNAATGRQYSGINILILWAAVIDKAYSCQRWLTFRQALSLGGAVRKGERGTTVVYADRFVPDDERERARRDGDEPESVPFLKRFAVFNVAQCEGLPESAFPPPAAPLAEHDPLPRAEALIAASGAHVSIRGDTPMYVPGADAIQMPPLGAFVDSTDYYATVLHELAHWTGHASRLNRDMSGRFGSHPYAREELVAEMASAFVCASLEIVPTVRHADYIGNWLTVLREDNRAIFRAASQASKASDFILAFEDGAKSAPARVAA